VYMHVHMYVAWKYTGMIVDLDILVFLRGYMHG
jgi:hypothetical protein